MITVDLEQTTLGLWGGFYAALRPLQEEVGKFMTDNVENIRLEHLRAIRAEIAGIRAEMDDMKLRMGSIEEHVAGMRRDMSILHGDIAIIHKRLDHHEEPKIIALS